MADIILAPYFTKNIEYHQHDSSNKGRGGSLPNDYNQMKNWYESVIKIDASACIFHNELSEEFIQKYQTDKIQFFKWTKEHRPSYNDERFYAYYEFLNRNPQIERIFCTDLYDVVFFQNPFRLMDKNPDYNFFSGSEKITSYSSKWMVRKCKEMKFPSSRAGFTPGNFLYNAGIVGGQRDCILRLFQSMIQKFNKINKKANANMPVYNYCLENLVNVKIFTGFPLHNVFNSHQVLDGLYIKHK